MNIFELICAKMGYVSIGTAEQWESCVETFKDKSALLLNKRLVSYEEWRLARSTAFYQCNLMGTFLYFAKVEKPELMFIPALSGDVFLMASKEIAEILLGHFKRESAFRSFVGPSKLQTVATNENQVMLMARFDKLLLD